MREEAGRRLQMMDAQRYAVRRMNVMERCRSRLYRAAALTEADPGAGGDSAM